MTLMEVKKMIGFGLKFKCGICGKIFKESDKKKAIQDIECPACKEKKVSLVKSRLEVVSKAKVIADRITTFFGGIIAAIFFHCFQINNSFFFKHGRDVTNIILLLVIIGITLCLQNNFLKEVPFYIVSLFVVGSFISIAYRR